MLEFQTFDSVYLISMLVIYTGSLIYYILSGSLFVEIKLSILLKNHDAVTKNLCTRV